MARRPSGRHRPSGWAPPVSTVASVAARSEFSAASTPDTCGEPGNPCRPALHQLQGRPAPSQRRQPAQPRHHTCQAGRRGAGTPVWPNKERHPAPLGSQVRAASWGDTWAYVSPTSTNLPTRLREQPLCSAPTCPEAKPVAALGSPGAPSDPRAPPAPLPWLKRRRPSQLWVGPPPDPGRAWSRRPRVATGRPVWPDGARRGRACGALRRPPGRRPPSRGDGVAVPACAGGRARARSRRPRRSPVSRRCSACRWPITTCWRARRRKAPGQRGWWRAVVGSGSACFALCHGGLTKPVDGRRAAVVGSAHALEPGGGERDVC